MSGRRRRELSPRERDVLKVLAEFRVLSGAQLQTLFFPDGSVIGTRRRTQACLKRLTDEKYLTRLERRVGGVRAGSASYCYCLGSRGQRLLAHPATRVRAPREPGLAFVRHLLAIGDVWVGLREAERAGELDVIEHQTEPDCWRITPKAFGASEWLRPDLFAAVGVADLEWRWFIEVDLGTESLKRVERTCQRYLAYYRSGVEQATYGVFPKVAWLATDQRRAEAIAGVVGHLPEADQRLFAVGQLTRAVDILKGGES